MSRVVEGWDIRYPEQTRARLPLVGPWRFTGVVLPLCRCMCPAEDHLPQGCQACACAALVAVGVARQQVRTVVDYEPEVGW